MKKKELFFMLVIVKEEVFGSLVVVMENVDSDRIFDEVNSNFN